jgi:hypothetical protein
MGGSASDIRRKNCAHGPVRRIVQLQPPTSHHPTIANRGNGSGTTTTRAPPQTCRSPPLPLTHPLHCFPPPSRGERCRRRRREETNQKKPPQLSCRIFSTTFNPTATRTGNRILRERLKGPSFLEYYPRHAVKIQDLKRAFPMAYFVDEEEKTRLSDVLRYHHPPPLLSLTKNVWRY